MLVPKPLALLASLAATTANALYFHLTDFRASDVRIPSESHALAFTISNPDAVFEQGGNDTANCVISWYPSLSPSPSHPSTDPSSTTTTPPPCWTPCATPDSGWGYYALLTPSLYAGAYNFTLQIQEYFAYRNSVLNNVSIPVVEGASEWGCSRGGQSTQCNFRNTNSSYDTGFETYYGTEKAGPICVV